MISLVTLHCIIYCSKIKLKQKIIGENLLKKEALDLITTIRVRVYSCLIVRLTLLNLSPALKTYLNNFEQSVLVLHWHVKFTDDQIPVVSLPGRHVKNGAIGQPEDTNPRLQVKLEIPNTVRTGVGAVALSRVGAGVVTQQFEISLSGKIKISKILQT